MSCYSAMHTQKWTIAWQIKRIREQYCVSRTTNDQLASSSCMIASLEPTKESQGSRLHDSYSLPIKNAGHLFAIIMWYCLVLSILFLSPTARPQWTIMMTTRERERPFRDFKGRQGSVHGWLAWQLYELERQSVSIRFYSAVLRMRKYARTSNSQHWARATLRDVRIIYFTVMNRA